MEQKFVENSLAASVKLGETVLRKAWSILDAASDKSVPSEYLTAQAISAIQGTSNSGQ